MLDIMLGGSLRNDGKAVLQWREDSRTQSPQCLVPDRYIILRSQHSEKGHEVILIAQGRPLVQSCVLWGEG